MDKDPKVSSENLRKIGPPYHGGSQTYGPQLQAWLGTPETHEQVAIGLDPWRNPSRTKATLDAEIDSERDAVMLRRTSGICKECRKTKNSCGHVRASPESLMRSSYDVKDTSSMNSNPSTLAEYAVPSIPITSTTPSLSENRLPHSASQIIARNSHLEAQTSHGISSLTPSIAPAISGKMEDRTKSGLSNKVIISQPLSRLDSIEVDIRQSKEQRVQDEHMFKATERHNKRHIKRWAIAHKRIDPEMFTPKIRKKEKREKDGDPKVKSPFSSADHISSYRSHQTSEKGSTLPLRSFVGRKLLADPMPSVADAQPYNTTGLEASKRPASQALDRHYTSEKYPDHHVETFECSETGCVYRTTCKDELKVDCINAHPERITYFAPNKHLPLPSASGSSKQEIASNSPQGSLGFVPDSSDVPLDSSGSLHLNDISEESTPKESNSSVEVPQENFSDLGYSSARSDSGDNGCLIPSREHSPPVAFSEEESSEGANTPSMDDGARLALAYAKHQIIVKFMRVFYATFTAKPQATVQNGTSPESSSSRGQAYHSQALTSGTQPTRRGAKRQKRQKDSPPPNDRDGKRGKRNSAGQKLGDQNRRLACPFHKFDPDRYGPNDLTYRSCAGPGFETISKLKQHLRRIHRAPIQCPRCWMVMANSQEDTLHANQETRCDRQDPQPQGINQEKMDLISSRHGATWDEIFEILFPGAQTPSPYFEACNLQDINAMPGSPGSQEQREYDNYTRTELPLLVEASIQFVIDTEMTPIEENVKKILVDIVRDCQSKIARNYEQMKRTRSSASTSTQHSSQGFTTAQTTEEVSIPNSQTSPSGPSRPLTLLNEESPHVAIDTVPAGVEEFHDNVSRQSHETQLNGYGSSLEPCLCNCHINMNMNEPSNVVGNCVDCAPQHNISNIENFTSDFLFDYDGYFAEPGNPFDELTRDETCNAE